MGFAQNNIRHYPIIPYVCDMDWKPVVGYENLYSVSDTGVVVKSNGEELTPNRRNGYWRYELWKNGKRTRIGAHRIVAEAFIPNPNGKPHINHKDGVKDNNSLDNLEWCTPKENVRHSIDVLGNTHGTPKGVHRPTPQLIKHWTGRNGKLHPRSKAVAQFDKNMNLIKVFESQNLASKETGINQGKICEAVNGKRIRAGGYIWKNYRV